MNYEIYYLGGVLVENKKNIDKKTEEKSETIEWIKSIATAVVIAILIKSFIFNTTYVLGNSMFPTLQEKDRLFANKVSLYFSNPSRGDIVVLEAPDEVKKDYIKRVIGVEGDIVEIKDGQVYLNGDVLEEPYLDEGSYTHTYAETRWEIPEGNLFVLGDNRNPGASKDSRVFGYISTDSIKGITGFRYFPINDRFGIVD